MNFRLARTVSAETGKARRHPSFKKNAQNSRWVGATSAGMIGLCGSCSGDAVYPLQCGTCIAAVPVAVAVAVAAAAVVVVVAAAAVVVVGFDTT